MSLAYILIKKLQGKGLKITTIESCTGGAIINALTNVSGSSEVITHAIVTYSKEAKIAIGIDPEALHSQGVYSDWCAKAMAMAGIGNWEDWQSEPTFPKSDVCIAVTGSLGRKDPANKGSVVGEVWICVVGPDHTMEKKLNLRDMSRPDAKAEIVERAIEMSLEALKD